MGRSRKPLWSDRATVGSNPTLSADKNIANPKLWEKSKEMFLWRKNISLLFSLLFVTVPFLLNPNIGDDFVV